MTEIVPGRLVLGSFEESFDAEGVLQKYGVTHVLNVAEECDVAGDERVGLEYRKYGMRDDDDDEDIRGVLQLCHVYLEEKRNSGGDTVVMVHCLEGVSRSACVVAWHLSMTEDRDFDDVMDSLRRLRPVVDPFPEYVRQAREFLATLQVS